jgi:hypothetical protein
MAISCAAIYSLLVHLPTDVSECDAKIVAYRSAPWRTFRDYVEDGYAGKGSRLVRKSVERVVAVGLLVIKSSGVAFTGKPTSAPLNT